MSAERLDRAVDRLVRQVAHWQVGRWAAAASGAESRAHRMFGLVQRLADRGADVEAHPRRTVPRVGDLVLADQLRVMACDLVTADAPDDVLAAAAADVDEVRRAL